jgi:hypothetical protein
MGPAQSLVLKLVLTPLLIGAASLAGRRWGSEIGGWLVGIPITSAPVALFLALGQGSHFAAQASIGILAGIMSQAAFALVYAWSAGRFGWGICFVSATIAFLAITAVLIPLKTSALMTFVLGVVVLVIALAVIPRRARARTDSGKLPAWDIPARMLVGTTFVIALTGAAPALGPRVAGLLSPFPLYAAVLAVFTHRVEGGASAVAVLRGLMLGLFAFAGFFVMLALLLVPDGVAVAFTVAVVVALAVQALSLTTGRRFGFA